MREIAATSLELWIALGALLASLVGSFVALLKLGPDRQATIVTAQDMVIDNLREEIERHRTGHERQIREVEGRYQRRIQSLERQLADEAELCDRRIEELRHRLSRLERGDRP